MTRRLIAVFFAAVAMTAGLFVAAAAPASAGTEVHRNCSGDAGVTGWTGSEKQITFLAGASFGHCGTLGIRVHYNHVGGSSWSSWKYSSWGGGQVTRQIYNSNRSEHSTSVGGLRFLSYR